MYSVRRNAEQGSGSATVRPCWSELSQRYPNERECLASFIALESAEVIAGEKPANLVCITNKARSCGRNLYQLWSKHGASLMAESCLRASVLADRGDSILLMFYRPESLQELLRRKAVAAILGKVGYPEPEDPAKALAALTSRIAAEAGSFPHEIGVFLGYPLKDVLGFMGWGSHRFTCQGPWKIFGKPEESLRLAEIHRECRCGMSSLLSSGCDPVLCLRGGATGHTVAGAAVSANTLH
ncbi:DUF3793 family protein [Geomonas sp.]|uniref:DUF3793 family protein n=1 Tax=Geomonas sp. TaxID=2651584 RepID=UPI002B490F23|nr:DUF3793 family protein [Geomonas sp.]HJV34008.1 DUF3793 family protein [Geomonas sp.]